MIQVYREEKDLAKMNTCSDEKMDAFFKIEDRPLADRALLQPIEVHP